MDNESGLSEPIVRAWILLKLEEDGDSAALSALAKDIYCAVNLHDEYATDSKVFVVRADLVEGDYDLVIPVTAGTLKDNKLGILESIIKASVEKCGLRLATGGLIRLKVAKHVPFPPHKAPGYVTEDEVNPLKQGPTGHNPW